MANNILLFLELLSAVCGLYMYRNNVKSVWFAFAIFLFFIFSMDLLGGWLSMKKMYSYNTNLFKWIVEPLLFTMYHIVFYTLVSKKIKGIVVISAVSFLLLTIVENVFWGKIHFYSNSLTMSYGCLMVLVFCMHFFYKLINSEEILNFKSLMSFWFCLGIFIFFLGSFPYLTFFNSLAMAKNKDIAQLYRWIFITLNWLMYLFFTIGFICSKQKQSLL
jgi:hypothetical protein